jgi:protein O-mannosyl-transferase
VTTPDAIAHIAAFAGAKLQLSEMLAFEYLGRYIEKHDCKGLGKDQLAALIAHIVDAAPQPAGLNQLWRSRFIAAQLYLAAGMLPNAQEQDALAWITGAADPAIGIHLANIYYLEGDKTSARLVLADAIKQIKPWDQRNLRLVRELTQQFENGQPAAATSAAAMH